MEKDQNDADELPSENKDVDQEIHSLTTALGAEDSANDVPDAPAKARIAPWRSWPAAIILLIVAAALTVANVVGVGAFKSQVPEPSAAEIEEQLRLELLATMGYIDDYREEHGVLPSNLTKLDSEPGEGVEYQLVDEATYLLTAAHDSTRITYDSKVDPADFFGELGGGK